MLYNLMAAEVEIMDTKVKEQFESVWQKYFNNPDLPIIFYYSDVAKADEVVKAGSVTRCIIGALSKVRDGKSMRFDAKSIGCFGGRRYLGFAENIRPNFEYFLSCGIPGEMEGERYKKSPEIVKEVMKNMSVFKAPAKYIAFKRWDSLDKSENPEAVIFFAQPDVLSGLFTLANFDEIEPNGVICPFGSGCSSIVYYPLKENAAARPRAVLGMFDVSARPFVHPGTLTFAVPFKKFTKMLDNVEESFLTTNSWKAIQKRIGKSLNR